MSSDLLKGIEAAVSALSPEQKGALSSALKTSDPIAVIGLGTRMPMATGGPEGFWRMLCAGTDAVRETPKERFDVDAYYDENPGVPGKMTTRWGAYLDDIRGFDAAFFGISPREACSMDPQQRLMLEVAWEAFEHAGVAGNELAGSRTGVFIGASAVEYALLRWPTELVDAYASSGTSRSIIANRLSFQFDLRGPSMAVDTACSSSLVALHLACRSLRAGDCEQALVGGVNALISPTPSISFSKWGMMAKNGRCKTFDARADGFVRGEGCGAVVLKRLSDAISAGDNIYSIVRGSAVNQDGKSAGLTAPNVDAQINVIKDALRDASTQAHEISYVEAHGTGTSLGDPIEVEALSEVHPADGSRCLLGSVKTNIGHLEGAAGIAGFIKTVLALHRQKIPPHLHFESPNREIRFEDNRFHIPTTVEEWPPAANRIATVSSFGFGGTNAHVVLEEAPRANRPSSASKEPWLPLVLSAHSESALSSMVRAYVPHLENHEGAFRDVCASATAARARHAHRAAIIARNAAEASQRLQSMLAGGQPTHTIAARRSRARSPRVAFVFTGQGSVWRGMLVNLLASDPAFMHRCRTHDEIVKREAGFSVLQMIEDEDERLGATEYGQQAILLCQLGLIDLLGNHGIRASAVIGHSCGEIAAAVAAGVLTADQAVAIIKKRADVMRPHRGRGAMAEVELPADRLRQEHLDGPLTVAAINHPGAAVVSGPSSSVAEFVETQQAAGVSCRMLDVPYAFHGRALRREAGALEPSLANLAFSKPKLSLFSTVTGRIADDATFDAHHFARNLADPVLFSNAIEQAMEDGIEVFVELGPHSPLCRSIKRIGSGATVAIPTLLRGRPDEATLLRCLAALDVEGVNVNWRQRYPKADFCYVPPPLYPWEHASYWGSEERGPRVSNSQRLLGSPLNSPALNQPVFDLNLDAPIVAEHDLGGRVVVPIVALIEAALLSRGRSDVHIENLSVSSPWEVSVGGQSRGQLIWSLDETSFEFRAANAEAPNEWRLHARGDVVSGVELPVFLNVATAQEITGTALAGDVYYGDLESRGAHLGPRFRRLARIGVGNSAVVAQLQPLTGHDAKFAAPFLLDGGLQLFLAALPERPPREAGGFVPVSVQRVDAAEQLDGIEWVKFTLIDQQASTLLADIGYYSADGEPIARLKGVRYVALRADHAKQTARKLLKRDTYVTKWAQDDSPPQSKPQSWIIVGGSKKDRLQVTQALGDVGDRVHRGQLEQLPSDHNLTGVIDLRATERTFGRDEDPINIQEALAELLFGLQQSWQLADSRAQPLRWIVATNRAHRVLDEAADPIHRALIGFARSAQLELQNVRLQCVDLDDDVTALVNERAESGEFVVAHRGGTRFVPRLERAPQAPDGALPLRANASYVVTGGLGGLGREAATWLATNGAKHLVLISRSRPTSTSELNELRDVGVSVQTLEADVGHADDLAEKWKLISPPVAGIIHAAGVLADAPLGEITASQLDAVLNPKVAGTMNLHAVAQASTLDFFISYSSAAGTIGNFGQAAYAAANAFVDAYAEHARGNAFASASIAWGPWRGRGMAARVSQKEQDRARRMGIARLEPHGATELLRTLHGYSNSIVLAIDWARFLESWPRGRDPFFSNVRPPPTLSGEPSAAFVARLSEAPRTTRMALMTERIRQLVAEVLAIRKPESIRGDLGLFDLGFDSVTGVELSERLQRQTGIQIPTTLIFEKPTVNALATFVLAELELVENAAVEENGFEGKSEDDLLEMLEREIAEGDSDE